MATGHIFGQDIKYEIKEEKDGSTWTWVKIKHPPELIPSKGGKMNMLCSLQGFTPVGMNLDNKPIKANIQIGV